MIERKPIIVACVAGTLFASCTPYPSNYRKAPNPPEKAAKSQKTVTSREQQKLREERKKARKEAEREAARRQKKKPDDGASSAPESTAPPAKTEYEYATPVPGRPGFVLSPYNGKMIDVKGIPSGTLVADPAYPASEKKYFLVP